MGDRWEERTELLLKAEGVERLRNANLLVVGLGGVGSFAAEFLARAGVGNLTIADGDVVDISNINRQLQALHSTVGRSKAELTAERLAEINPKIRLKKISSFLNPDEMEKLLDGEKFHYVLDCIDSLQPKIALIKAAKMAQDKNRKLHGRRWKNRSREGACP